MLPPHPKVLLVDHSGVVLQRVRLGLEARGFGVATFGLADGVCQAILDEEPDVVMLDVQASDVGGSRIVDLFRSCPSPPRAAILLFSILDPAKLRALQSQWGADGWLSKWWSMETIAESVGRFLPSRRSVEAVPLGGPASTPPSSVLEDRGIR